MRLFKAVCLHVSGTDRAFPIAPVTPVPEHRPEPPSSLSFPQAVLETIFSFASRSDLARLSRVCQMWHIVADEQLWAHIDLGLERGKPRQIELSKKVKRRWQDCLNALHKRPRRVACVRKLHAPSTAASTDVVAQVLTRCQHRLSVIRQTLPGSEEPNDNDDADYRRDRGRNVHLRSFAQALSRASSLPYLTTLHLELGHTWEEDLRLAVGSTPNLVDLSITVQNPHPWNRPPHTTHGAVHLPKLVRFQIDSPRCESGIWMIKHGAPLLENLTLWQPFGRKWTRPHLPGERVLLSQEWRVLRLEGEVVSAAVVHLLSGRHVPRIEGVLPRLQHLFLVADLRPESFPRHQHLASLCLQYPNSLESLSHYCGTLPSGHMTGAMAPWFLAVIQNLPELKRIELRRWRQSAMRQASSSERPCASDVRGSFHIRAFASEDDDDLYVISYQSMSPDIPFAPRMTPAFASLHSQGADAECWRVPPEGVLPRFSGSSWYHLTSYRGRPVPLSLLHQCTRSLAAGWDPLQGR